MGNQMSNCGWHDIDAQIKNVDLALDFVQHWKTCNSASTDQNTANNNFKPKQHAQFASPGSMQLVGSFHGECSMYAAFLDVIDRAKDFIYIENQYFVSWFGGERLN